MAHARVAVLAIAALLASCSAAPPRDTTPAPAPVTAAPDPAKDGITVAAVGDVMMGTDYPDNILPDDDGVGFLGGVAPVLSAADVAFANLEGVLMDGGEAVKRCKRPEKKQQAPAEESASATASTPPAVPTEPAAAPAADSSASAPSGTAETGATETPAPPAPASDAAPSDVTPQAAAPPPPPPSGGGCFVFRSPTRYATYLRDAGIDIASLANNHAQDFGDPGRDSTMRALDDVGIKHSGREGDVAEWTTRGRRMALVAFAPNVGSHQLNDLVAAQDVVTKLAARNDIVIVSFHGGGEGEGASRLPFARELYQGEDRGDVVEFAHTVIDAGADLVIGHGPHVLRAMELYRDRLVAYSLGNFATYYGISVTGIRGISAVMQARLAADGRFLDGDLHPTIQIRPAGPSIDPDKRAVEQLRALTSEAFPEGALEIREDGKLTRKGESP